MEKRHFVTGWLSFAGKFFYNDVIQKRKAVDIRKVKKETWRHEKLSTKNPDKNP